MTAHLFEDGRDSEKKKSNKFSMKKKILRRNVEFRANTIVSIVCNWVSGIFSI